MKPHEFVVVLDRDPSEDESEALYRVFNDGSIYPLDGVAQIAFRREALTLEEAIRSSIAEVMAAGFTPTRVEIAPASLSPA